MPGPRSHAPIQKPKNTKGTALRLLKYVGRQKALLIGMIVFALVSSAATVSASIFIKPIIDDYLTPMIGKEFTAELALPLIKMILTMGAVFLLGVIASYGQSKCSVYLTEKTLNSIRKDLFDRVSDLPLSFFDSRPNGEIMSRFTNDVESLRMFLSQGLTQFVSSGIMLIGSFVIMLYLSWHLTILVVLMMFVMLFITKVLGKRSAF